MVEKNKNTTIFIAGGGTGGHLFPAIAILEELKKRGHDVHLITDSRCMGYLKNHKELQAHIINSSSIKSGLIGKFLSIFRIIYAIFQTFILFRRYKPSLIMGFGGYPAFPSLFCGTLMDIPIVIHEQNCFLGKVNNYFAKKAQKLLLTFDETSNIPDFLGSKKIIVTGNPVRSEIKKNVIKKDFKSRPFKILVTGGSQGAAIFSSLIPEAIKIVKASEPKIDLEIVHQVRLEDLAQVRRFYKSYEICSEVESFFYNMPELLSDAHLFIGRAGASTISELIEFVKPSILVPYPFAAQKHQDFNAKVIEKIGGGWCYNQNSITSQILADKILEITKNDNILEKASKNLKLLQKDSTNIIADTVEKIIAHLK